MQMRRRVCQNLFKARAIIANQIFHFHARSDCFCGAQGHSANGTNMVLKLAGGRAFDGPMPAIVHAGRDFVEHWALRAGKEFGGEHADIV